MQFESSRPHQHQHQHHHHQQQQQQQYQHHSSQQSQSYQHQQHPHSQHLNNPSPSSSSSPASSLMPPSPAASSIGSGSLVEEHVVALHDFSSNNSTCLSFQQGQVIKVFTRDDSGWWDGELDGNRGWFPSNYVDESGMSVGLAAAQASNSPREIEPDDGNVREGFHYSNDQSDRYRSQVNAPEASSSGGYQRGASSPSRSHHQHQPSSSRISNYDSDSSQQSPNLSSSSSGVIDPIVHAIALLHNAARAHRVAHFQPSTSCVISSVRSVLSATDCLTRESPVLQAHPILGRERKAILSELSRLVNQSRKASSTNLSLENNDFEREAEMRSMLIMADQVLKNVKRFLNVAVDCGVDVPNRRSSVYDDLITSERRPSATGSVGSSTAYNHTNHHHIPDRSEEDKTPTPDSPKSAYTYVTAKSNTASSPKNTKFNLGKQRASSYYSGHHQSDEEDGDVDNNRRSGPFLLPTTNQFNRSSSKSRKKEENHVNESESSTSNNGNRIRSGSTSEDPMESAGESNESNSRSGSGSGSSESVNEPISLSGLKLKTPLEVISRARASEQELISIVAAFIGHAHTHTRGSPASSYAQLIERTRETVDGVRNLLSVIEAVHNNEKLQSLNPHDMKTLWEAREGLYEATSALVTAARLITSASSSNNSSPNPAFGEDEEKARLLAAATNVYRTGQECASVVDFCLKRISKDGEVLIALEDRAPSPNASNRDNQRRNHQLEQQYQNDPEGEDYDEDEELGSNGQSLKRGKHTLSFLGRKATSLNCLREKYETHHYSSDGFEKVNERDVGDDAEDEGKDEDGDISRNGRSSSDSYGRVDSTPTPNGMTGGSKISSSSTMSSSRAEPDLDQDTARIIEPTLLSERRGVSTPKPLMGRIRASTTAGLTNRPQLPGRKPPSTPLDSSLNGDSSDGFSESQMTRDDSRISGASTTISSSTRSSTTTDTTSTRPSMEHSDSDPFPRSDSNNSLSTTSLNSRSLHGDLLSRRQLSEQSSGSSPTASSVSSFQGNRFRSGTLDDRSLPSIPSSDAKFLSTEFHPDEVSYNSEGQVTGATLEVLVEKMSPHGSTPDNTFSRTFFLCFRLFTTPLILFELLVSRYNLQLPEGVEASQEDAETWNARKLMPIRVRTLNVFKTWLEVHWNPSTDHLILDKLIEFLNNDCFDSNKNLDEPLTALERQGRRLAELAQKRIISGPLKNNLSNATNTSGFRPTNALQRTVSTDRLKSTLTNSSILESSGALKSNPSSPIGPQPIISKGLSSILKLFPSPSVFSSTNSPSSVSLPTVNVTEFDPLELARQLTLMENREFCKILPEELLGQEFSKKANVSNAIHVKKMSSLSTNITGWISECILGEPDARRRTGLVKFFVKLGDVSVRRSRFEEDARWLILFMCPLYCSCASFLLQRCASLNNFNTLMAIQCALNSSTISRLKRTWDGLPTKYRIMMDNQRRSVEHTRNFAGYRNKLRETLPPALPFLGLFLTDLTFCHEGNASTRPSPLNPKKKLLNFDKYVKMSRIIGELQRFQLPYNLIEVQEIQNYLNYVLENVGDSNNSNGGMGVAEDLYRKSLLLEPRNSEISNNNTNAGNTGTIGRGKGDGDSKLAGLDFFNWK